MRSIATDVTFDVVVVGALHHDCVVRAPRLPKLDETLLGQSVSYVCGGKGGNQARAAARLGATTAMVGAVGHDDAGAVLRADLETADVDTSFVRQVAEPSGMSVAIVEDGGEYGAVVVSGANLRLDPDADLPAGRVALFQNELPAPTNLALMKRANVNSRVVWNAAPLTERDATVEEMASLCDLIVLNRVEASAWLNCEIEVVADAVNLDLPCPAIVTLGADGCLLFDGARRHVPAPRVEAVSAHGAGDVFVGALVGRWTRDDTLPDAVVYASRAAAAWVSRDEAARERFGPEGVQSIR